MIDQFETFKPNSVIFPNNGVEFKSYEYKLLTMIVNAN